MVRTVRPYKWFPLEKCDGLLRWRGAGHNRTRVPLKTLTTRGLSEMDFVGQTWSFGSVAGMDLLRAAAFLGAGCGSFGRFFAGKGCGVSDALGGFEGRDCGGQGGLGDVDDGADTNRVKY